MGCRQELGVRADLDVIADPDRRHVKERDAKVQEGAGFYRDVVAIVSVQRPSNVKTLADAPQPFDEECSSPIDGQIRVAGLVEFSRQHALFVASWMPNAVAAPHLLHHALSLRSSQDKGQSKCASARNDHEPYGGNNRVRIDG